MEEKKKIIILLIQIVVSIILMIIAMLRDNSLLAIFAFIFIYIDLPTYVNNFIKSK